MTFRTNNTGSSASNCITLPLLPPPSGTYNFTVNWGDGQSSTITSWNQAEVTHCYATAGTYTIGYSGTIQGWSFNNRGDAKKLLSVTRWGPLQLRASGSFWGCSNLTLTGSQDVLDLTGTPNMDSAFRNCSSSSFTTVGNIASWNMSGVTNTFSMFENSWNFNDNIGAWNVSNVINMANMFSDDRVGYNCMSSTAGMAFNNGGSPSIANWNTANVLTMQGMFEGCKFFNQPIGTWNTGKVASTTANLPVSNFDPTNVSTSTSDRQASVKSGFIRMFSNAWAFNQPLASGSGDTWNITGGTNTDRSFDRMFNCAKIYNQDLSTWRTTKFTFFGDMFKGADLFNNANNPAIGLTWDVSNSKNLGSMFQGTSFNQPLPNWYPGKSGSVGGGSAAGMFRSSPFNQPLSHWGPFMNRFKDISRMFDSNAVFNQNISSWDVSEASDMEGMFTGATVFNQNIGSWNTAKLTDMPQMFKNASAFNQNLGSWSVGKLTPGATWAGAWEAFQGSGLSTANVDALLCGWAPQTVSASVTLTLGTAGPSCATGQPCKTTLAGKGWTITSATCV